MLGRRIFLRLLVVEGGDSIGVRVFGPSLNRLGMEDLGGSRASLFGELNVEEVARGFCWITEPLGASMEELLS